MDRTRKGIVYLKQKGVDVDRSRKQLDGSTYDKLKETYRRLMPGEKIPRGGKAGIIDALIVHIHREYFTPRQRRRLGMN
jgi:hypothetical protein